ncbi:BON domain-containing protein [Rhodoferax sp.]|uniref:BON domain-containing protein n=1 Tax=Rhodoferax sp. TaxID=50421 RepID=UPI00374D7D2F
MSLNLSRIAASTLIALAAGPFLMSSSMAASDEATIVASAAPTSTAPSSDKALAVAVADALSKSLGDSTVKNVKVVSSDGTVTLNGWINSPDQESKARKVASTVPGAAKVYSRLRMWSTENNN